MKKRFVIPIVAVIGAGLLIVLFAGQNPPSQSEFVPHLPPSKSATRTSVSTVSPARLLTPTETWDSRVQTNMAEAPMRWTSVAATNAARGVSCLPGFELEQPASVASMSTDRWTIFTCSPQRPRTKKGETPVTVDYRTRYTKVISVDRAQEWTIPHAQFGWANRPNAFLATYRWSMDGKYLYLLWHYSPATDWFGPLAHFHASSEDVALFRLDLDTGKFDTILPYHEEMYAFAISPDDRFLAYRNPGEPTVIIIWDLITNEEKQKRIFGDYILTGAITWRPDSASLFFASVMSGWEQGKAGISLFSISIRDTALRTILYNDSRMFIPFPCWSGSAWLSWVGDDLLYVTSLNEKADYAYLPFLLNVWTGEAVPAYTPTPSPKTTAIPEI